MLKHILLGAMLAMPGWLAAYTVNGHISNAADGKVYLLKPKGESWVIFDSASIIKGHFSLKGMIGKPGIVRFQYSKYEYPLVFLALTDTVYRVEGTVHSSGRLIRPVITGGALQQAWNTVQEEQAEVYGQKRFASFALLRLQKENRTDSVEFYQAQERKAEQQEYTLLEQQVLRNAGNVISSYLLYSNYYQFSFVQMQKLAGKINGYKQKNDFITIINKRLNVWRQIQPGMPAPDFVLADPQGVRRSLKDFRGRYLVIDFWASWCGPCRKENPSLVEWYHSIDKNKFAVLGISIDEKKDAWLKAIEKDQLPWSQLIDPDGWKSATAGSYAVGAVPQKFLIDPSGKIVLANVDMQEVKEWMNKQ
ncbi:MAG: redoxin domain-containing protein [Pseudobacter sp.]|uniref:redoxin domain-containing protein n=1 Tax=Pseudobacter sp. TaxID=2045420 RepID=UPI003F7E43D4